MAYLYHVKPKTVWGDNLVPLNELRYDQPELYRQAFQKYVGREELTKVKFPILNCLWNDVIHFCPIHPTVIRKALSNFNSTYPDVVWLRFPVIVFKEIPALYFDDSPSEWNGNYNFNLNCFRPFEVDSYRELHEVSDATLAYYKNQFDKGKKPLLFNGVQHILVKASLPFRYAEEIIW
jgi:hypothetical protein